MNWKWVWEKGCQRLGWAWSPGRMELPLSGGREWWSATEWSLLWLTPSLEMIICRTWHLDSYILLDFFLSQQQLFLIMFHVFLFSTPQTSGPQDSVLGLLLFFIFFSFMAFHHPYSFCCYCSWGLKKIFFNWSIVDLQCCASFNNPAPGHITEDNHNPKRYMCTCTPVFIATLFTIAGAWKQRGCPLTDKWIKKVWYIYTLEYHSAIKRKEVILFTCNNMDGPRDCHTKWSLSPIF